MCVFSHLAANKNILNGGAYEKVTPFTPDLVNNETIITIIKSSLH